MTTIALARAPRTDYGRGVPTTVGQRRAVRRAPTKRPAKAPLVRGEPVVERVLSAAIEELARSGYKALRVEEVARRAGVNKTTVYRRWPEKTALVRDALWTYASESIVLPSTGSLRDDLVALGKAATELFARPAGQSITRILVAEGSDPEVAELKRALRTRHEAIPRAVIAAAVDRGELARGQDYELLFQAFMGTLHHRLFFEGSRIDAAYLARLVDLLLDGALATAGKPARRRRD